METTYPLPTEVVLVLGDTEAGAAVLDREIDKTTDTFISENSEKLGDAQRQIDDLTQKLARPGIARAHDP